MISARPALLSLSVILSLLYLPLAPAEPFSVKIIPDSVTTKVFRQEAELGFLHPPAEFRARDADGLVQIGTAEAKETRSMRLFARAHPSSTFVLTANVGSLSTPAFDGVVLDEHGQPIANLSLKTLTTEEIVSNGDRAFRRMERYSKAEKWSEFMRKSLFSEVDGVLPPEITLLGPDRMDVFEETYASARKMVRYFAPGHGRPNWLLLDLTALPVLSRARITEIARALTTPNPDAEEHEVDKRTRLVLLLNADKLYTMQAGGWVSQPLSCAARL